MILVDTNIVLAFIHRDVKERAVVRRQITEIRGGPLLLTPPVLHEVMDFLHTPHLIDRMSLLIDELAIEWFDPGSNVSWQDVVKWLRRYSEHEPDFVDGYLCVLAATDKHYRVWSNDSEFRTIWRRPDGSRVPMAVKG